MSHPSVLIHRLFSHHMKAQIAKCLVFSRLCLPFNQFLGLSQVLRIDPKRNVPEVVQIHEFPVYGPKLVELVICNSGPELRVILLLESRHHLRSVFKSVRFFQRRHKHGFNGRSRVASNQLVFWKVLQKKKRSTTDE